MEGLFTLLALSMVMAIVSFVVGSLPLTFSLSSSQLRLISALGMGLLVGTSLIVIIPEGVETLYSSSVSTSHQHRRRELTEHAIDVRWLHGPSINTLVVRDEPRDEPKDDKVEPPSEAEVPDSTNDSGESKSPPPSEKEELPVEEDEPGSPHAWIGVALISGFVVMYLIDKLPQFATSFSKTQQRPYHISLDNLSSGLGRGVSPARTGGLLDMGNSTRQTHSIATTTGLVFHSVADGVALGASTSSTSLTFIVFFAIMVHKAPAAFGLTSVLLKQGLSNRVARAHLAVFSLAAPAGALLTWLIAHTAMASYPGDEKGTQFRTGILLLFSAGTFLYVAMHAMQDSDAEPTRRDSQANGYIEGRESSSQRSQKSMRDLIASVVGMILPLFMQLGHAH
ncbi:hypothetical protein AJ80_05446 [Polytolypa hystricis UAMH7299]|uniref:Zinc/iron permease n=1 Tax=Polytolypa hystricis (strain UAMH7299) TaxID=1447883 RepID=A0A2B7Y4G1_POLH7|nr:hypothetical protein AJ80_05446 [Polytolypa hystricis UAMH7299]